MPIEPIEQFLARQGVSTPRPFSSPALGPKPPGGEDPGVFAGFAGSVASSIPELFGAPPSQLAEGFRQQHPIAGFASELAGMAVPYLGAERVAQLPSFAPKLAGTVENILGRVGMSVAENPIAAGVTRELIVNAPVEASRLAVGSVLYPDNHDLWSDVALNYALTGGIGGLGGWFRAGGKVLSKAGQVEGADIFMAPTHQLKLVLDGGSEVNNVPKEEFIPQLREQILTETPGKAGASGKDLPYILPLQGISADDNAAINSLFKPERPKAATDAEPSVGLVKQRLDEGRSPLQLNAGQQQAVVDMLPDTVKSIDDIAKNVQFPRLLTVADQAGARAFAGIASKPSWMTVSDRLALMQEQDGGFMFKYKLADGKGQGIGKGAGKTKVGEQYLIGKTINPGFLDPKAQQLADMVTASWSKMGTAFSPGAFNDVFNQHADIMMRSMSVVDYHNLSKLPEAEWKAGFKERVGRLLAQGDGLLDSKLGYRDSSVLHNLADQAYAHFKPTEFLQRQNPAYGRFFGLMRNSYRVADDFASRIMKGQMELKPGTNLAQAIRSKGVKYVSGFENHRPVNEIIDGMSNDEVNLMAHLSGTDRLSDEGLAQLIADGALTTDGAAAIKELRGINEDVINKLVMPVFKETGFDAKWLENHLGIPHISRGDLFYAVTDAKTGAIKHLAFGKNGAQAMREAKVVQETAAEAGKSWKIEKAKPQHLAAESEDTLASLGKQIFQNIQKTPEEGELIYRAMRRLSTIKATSGRNPSIPVSSGMFQARGGVPTSYRLQQYSKSDVLNSMEGHLKQLLHFAGMQSWKERFGSVAAHMLKDKDPTLYGDLIRKGNQMLGVEGKITNVLNDTLRPVLGGTFGAKPATKIASAVNKYIAAANLFWLNPTFAVLNLLTPLQTVAPWIAHMRIASEADLAKTTYMQLTPALDAKGLPTGVAAFTDPMKILAGSVQLMRKPTEELKGFFEQADTDGLFHPQIFEEWLGRHTRAQQTLGGAFKEDGIGGFLKQMATYPADASEKFSRLSAFNAAYIVGKDYFNLEGDALYRFMRRGVEVTQYNYAAVDRSRIFTGPVGSMFGLFKNWQMHFLGNMLSYAGLIKNDAGNPAAWAPLLWTVGSATALGGLGATPLVGIADGIAQWHDKSSNSFLWTQKNFSPVVGDAVYFGLPAFLGVSLQASTAIPGTDVRNETASLFSFAVWQRAKQLGQAVSQIASNELTYGHSGLHIGNQLESQLFSAIAPRFMTKIFASLEGDYVKSMSSGSPQVRNVSPVAKLLNTAGFNPIDVAQWQEASRRMYSDQTSRMTLVQNLGRAYSDATLNGDQEEAHRILQRAIAAGELPSVMHSAATHNKREQSGDVLSRYNKQQQSTYRQVLQPQQPGP